MTRGPHALSKMKTGFNSALDILKEEDTIMPE
jgi:hypothetical protein